MNYKELKDQLIKATKAYYENSNPIMSDFEFDKKLKELEKMEEIMGYRDPDSPTINPGSDLSLSNSENQHKRPMLSLENTYTYEEIEKWYFDMAKATGDPEPEVVVNPKWDGCSASIHFNNGVVRKALTRGDGNVGEDMTKNVSYCSTNIWPRKGYLGLAFTGEARGELIITKKGFEELNKEGKYQNARNLVSGTLKLLDIDSFIPRAEYIKFYAYWLEDMVNSTYKDDLIYLKLNGFDVGDYYVCRGITRIKEAIEKIEENKDSYDVEIDGAVIKLNEKKYWNQIGSTAKFPRWAKAYKYKQESVESIITKIDFQVGRTGKITPVAYFEPRFIDGSTIQKATLNNKEFYDNMDIAEGDTIEVQKAAAIIPQIIGIVDRPSNRRKILFPSNCPCCNSPLRKHNEEHNDLFCDNASCKSRIVDQIINYTHTLEIDGFAEVIVERLHDAGLLESISDLYRLKESERKKKAASLDRLSENIVEKLIANIEAKKSVEFWRVLAGLGIPNIGPKTSKIIVKKFSDIDSLMNATKSSLLSIDGIADITADGILDWFNNNKALIKELKSFGVKMESTSKSKTSNAIDLSGKRFCFTGTLSRKREYYVKLIEELGGQVTDSVSKITSYLVTNTPNSGSSKNANAKKFGIPIITESEFLILFNIE